MSGILKLTLITASIINMIFVLYRIRKAKIQINDSIFWISFSLFLIFISFFPEVAVWATKLAGIQTTSNFIYLLIIFVLIVKTFLMSMKVSQLEIKLKVIAQKIALDEFKSKEAEAEKRSAEKKSDFKIIR